MRRWLGLGAAALALGLALTVGVAEPAFADNCQTPSDCFSTADAASEALLGILFLEALSFVLSMIPVVGWVKGVIEAGTGEDLVTGRKLSDAERYAGAIPWGKLAVGAGALAGLAGAGFAVARYGRRGGRALDEAALLRRVEAGGPPPRRGAEDLFPGLRRVRPTGGGDCSRCTFESMHRIRGLDVPPLPPASYRGMSDGEIATYIRSHVRNADDLANFRWRHGVGHRYIPNRVMTDFDPFRGRQEIVDMMRARPDGAQSIISVNVHGQGGHVFHAIHHDGEVYFLDRHVPGGEWMRGHWAQVDDISILHIPDSYFP